MIEQIQTGFYTAVGFAGTGFMHASAVGMILCHLITKGHTDKIDILKFSSARFAEPPEVEETTGF